MIILKMKNCDMIWIEKLSKYLLYDQAKYEYVKGEKTLPSIQKRIIEKAKFIYYPLAAAFEKQTKIIEDQGKKQVDALKNLISNTQELTIKNMIAEDIFYEEAKDELNKIKEMDKFVDKEILIYRASEYIYSFQNFETIKTFGRDTYNGEITWKEADENLSNLLVEIINLNNKTKAQNPEKKHKKDDIPKNWYPLFNGRKGLDAF